MFRSKVVGKRSMILPKHDTVTKNAADFRKLCCFRKGELRRCTDKVQGTRPTLNLLHSWMRYGLLTSPQPLSFCRFFIRLQLSKSRMPAAVIGPMMKNICRRLFMLNYWSRYPVFIPLSCSFLLSASRCVQKDSNLSLHSVGGLISYGHLADSSMTLDDIERAPSSCDTPDKEADTTKSSHSELPRAEVVDYDDYPDGGLRAWLIVFGVGAGSMRLSGFYWLFV